MYLWLSNAIHGLEEAKLPMPSSKAVLVAGAVAVPVCVVLNELAEYWVPKKVQIPVFSYFQRRWYQSPNNKASDLVMFRSAAVFLWIACTLNEENPKFAPLDYVSDRLVNTQSRKQMDRSIHEHRSNAFVAANEALTAAAFDEAKAATLRDAAIHRRSVQGE
jgi:hypothetical protein